MKKVKFALPLLALLFAVAGALATGTSTPLVQTVVSNQSTCQRVGTCDQSSTADCMNNLIPLYVRATETSCDVPADGIFDED